MSNQLIELLKSQNRQLYVEEARKFDEQSIAEKAKEASKLHMQKQVYEDAIKIQGNLIYKKQIENQALREQLGTIDENKVKKYTEWHNLNDSDEVKNKVIYEELMKEINSTNKVLNIQSNSKPPASETNSNRQLQRK
jgi:hypothetical protein